MKYDFVSKTSLALLDRYIYNLNYTHAITHERWICDITFTLIRYNAYILAGDEPFLLKGFGVDN